MFARTMFGVAGLGWLVVAACGDAGGTTTEPTTTGGTTDATSASSFPGTTTTPTSGTTDGPSAPTTSTGTTEPTGTSTSDSSSTSTGSTSTGSTDTGSTDTGSTDTSSTDTGSTDTGSTDTGSTDTSSTGGGSSDTGTSSDTGGACGDGVVDGDEACDDGDAVDDDECGNDCTLPTCDDGQQNGDEQDVDCGGADCPTCQFALLFGGNASKSVGASFDGAAWTVSDIPAPTVEGVALTITGLDTGVGVFRYTKIGDPEDNQLQYVTWKDGVWSPPQQVGTSTTRAAPSIASRSFAAHMVFQGENYQFYHANFDGMGWAPTAEPIGSFGPGPGSVTAQQPADALFVFHDGAQGNPLTARRRVAAWLPPQVIDPDPQMFDRQPVVTDPSGDVALAVHARNAGGQLRWTAIVAPDVWSPPADVPGAQTSHTPALISTLDGGAAMAFRGTDGKAYFAEFNGIVWTAPVPVGDPNPGIFGPPALAPGVGDAEFELLYLDAGTKTVRHVRRFAGLWSAPALVGATPLERVALARSQ